MKRIEQLDACKNLSACLQGVDGSLCLRRITRREDRTERWEKQQIVSNCYSYRINRPQGLLIALQKEEQEEEGHSVFMYLMSVKFPHGS